MKKTLYILAIALLLPACGTQQDEKSDYPFGTQAQVLLSAVRAGNLEMVKKQLKKGIDINSQEEVTGFTPAHLAIIEDNPDLLEFLIANGADLNVKDVHGNTPLHMAAIYANYGAMIALLKKGADPNAKDNEGNTPLDVVRGDDDYCITRLRKHGGRSGKALGSLIEAAKYGDKEKVKQFLAAGADINQKDDEGKTALHYASQHGELELARLLIAAGADVNARDYHGTPLHLAAEEGNAEVVEFLLAYGADMKQRYTIGKNISWTVLQMAAMGGHKKAAEVLIAHGADIDEQGGGGKTPLHTALSDNKVEMVEFLIDSGAKVNTKERFSGMTPLHEAARQRLYKTARILIRAGARVNEKDNEGHMPLHFAAGSGAIVFADSTIYPEPSPSMLEIAELLMSQGADVNAKDNNGTTALDISLATGYEEMAKLLRSYGGVSGKEIEEK